MSDLLARFDIENPELPAAIRDAAMTSGGYPYDERLKKKRYQAGMHALQLQLVALQDHMARTGQRIAVVFEGRDAAGKGGTIKRYTANLNPRYNLVAALPKPSDRERTQWYFQRYVEWLPAGGEQVLFDRSWYNRAGVEPVMGFCTPQETERFLEEAPHFEQRLTRDGIHLTKIWLSIGREMQFSRFHARRHDPLKRWKLSPIDLEALTRWDEYSAARDRMLTLTDSPHAPWTVILANDKRRARLNAIRAVLSRIDYAGRDEAAIGAIDPAIVMGAEAYLNWNRTQ